MLHVSHAPFRLSAWLLLAVSSSGQQHAEGLSTETIWTLVFSGLVAFATLVYAALTWTLVSETRRMRRAQTDPHVVVWVVPSAWAFGFADLIVKNFGGGPATDVKFEIIQSPSGGGDAKILETLNGLGFLNTGFDYLAPGYEHRTYLATILGRSDAEMQSNIHIRVNYLAPSGQPLHGCYPLDLSQFANHMRIGNPPLETIATELERARKTLDAIAAKYLHEHKPQ